MNFYIETSKYARIKKLLILAAIVPGAVAFALLLLKLSGESLSDPQVLTIVFSAFLFVGFTVASIAVYFSNRSHCVVHVFNDGSVEIVIRDRNDLVHRAHGFWMCDPLYTKTYYKYGTYRKHLQVVLYCNELVFGIFRQEIAPAFSVPAGFREVVSDVAGAPIYFTKETLALLGYINSVNQHRCANPMQQYDLWKEANARQMDWRTGKTS